MSGQKGQHGPLFLKCSRCKKSRDHRGFARSGELSRTGRTRETRTAYHRPIKTAHELRCQRCGHVGWYTHDQAARLPLSAKDEAYYRMALISRLEACKTELENIIEDAMKTLPPLKATVFCHEAQRDIEIALKRAATLPTSAVELGAAWRNLRKPSNYGKGRTRY